MIISHREMIRGPSSALAEPEREVLALCDWAGLSYAEAAVALGVPQGTVRSRLSRARQHLRESPGVHVAVTDPALRTGR